MPIMDGHTVAEKGLRRQVGEVVVQSHHHASCGRAIISQKIAVTAPKAGKPKANHSQNSL
jgi:hypothetical protein